MSSRAMNMPTHITTNGPRLRTQLKFEGGAIEDMAAAVIVRPPKRVACPRRRLSRGLVADRGASGRRRV